MRGKQENQWQENTVLPKNIYGNAMVSRTAEKEDKAGTMTDVTFEGKVAGKLRPCN